MNPRPHDGLHAVTAALDAAAAPVSFFLRDDDAGWADERLFALLRCTASAGVPIDLAVIPQATGVVLAAELSGCVDASGGLIGLHQHGHAHIDHEGAGRKCEFGPARSLALQRHDLQAGRAHLRALFGTRLDGFFTPPWNRCAGATPALLAELGYSGLSRDRSAPPQHALPELGVDVDWCRQQRLEPGESDAVAFELARHVRPGATVGLMLHHARMSNAELDRLQTWLRCWSRHPNARWRPMRELLGTPARVNRTEGIP